MSAKVFSDVTPSGSEESPANAFGYATWFVCSKLRLRDPSHPFGMTGVAWTAWPKVSPNIIETREIGRATLCGAVLSKDFVGSTESRPTNSQTVDCVPDIIHRHVA